MYAAATLPWEIQKVLEDAVDQWRKRLEACIRAEGGHFEHLL